MPGELVPLVMLPRYTTLAGASTFTTIAMDVTEYSSAILNIWRGRLISGTSPDPTIAFTCQESTDQEVWSDCAGTNTVDYDPTEELEGQAVATLKKRWFRLKVVLTKTDAQATMWAVGFLEQRES